MLTSFETSAEAPMASPPRYWPSRFSLENYRELANFGEGVTHYLWNSGSIALMTVVATLVISTLAGYGFSRFRFPGRNLLFMLILSTLMIPFQSILNPLFILLRAIHLQDTKLGLALVHIDVPVAVRGVHDAQLLRRRAARNRRSRR